MSSTYSHYYDVIKRMSSLAGQWPYQTPRMKLFCLGLVTLTIVSIFIPQTAKFVKCGRDLQCIFESVTSFTLPILTLIKLYTCHFNRYKLKILLEHFFVNWDKLKTPEEYELMKGYAEKNKRFCFWYSIYYFVTAWLFMSVSLVPKLLDVVSPLNESRPALIPYPAYYFVDEQKYYLYIYCHSLLTAEAMMIGLVAHDCILITCIDNICSTFAVVGLRFQRLVYENAPVNVLPACPSDNSYRERIARSVYMHQRALKFAEFLTDMFSLSLILQVSLNAVVISITLLQITQRDADIISVTKYIMYFTAQLIHLFYFSFEGQKLIDHSLQVREKIYGSLWYKTPVKSKQVVLFVIQKGCRPVFLSAGKIFIFSLENFTTILQTSMSYFTMLASLE